MSKLFSYFLLFLLSFNLLIAEDLDFLDSSEGSILLEANGYGDSPDKSKKNALQELVFKIKSNVETSVDIKTSANNDKITKKIDSSIKIDGKSFFEGVHYSTPLLKDSSYYTRVVITEKSLKTTLLTLYSQVDKSLEVMSKKQKRDSLEMLMMIHSLLPYKNASMDIQTISLSKVKERQSLLNRSLNMAKIVFKINSPDATIEIGTKSYKSDSFIYLEAGNYTYTIKSKGYHVENGNLYAQAGANKTIKKDLIAVSDQKMKIYIHTDSSFQIKDEIASILSRYDIQQSRNSSATNALDFKFNKESITYVGNTRFYKLSLTVHAYKGTELYMTKTATIKRVAKSRLSSKFSKLAKALTKAILKKLDMKKFQEKTAVDYKFL